MVVIVATIALAATIQETGLGSGVMVSNTKVLNQVFSTAQAICPVIARAIMTAQVRVDILDVVVELVIKRLSSETWCPNSKVLWRFLGQMSAFFSELPPDSITIDNILNYVSTASKTVIMEHVNSYKLLKRSTMSTIIVDKIAKSFGSTQAVKDVSFEVHPGEIFGLLGPNGSGKTTSIRVILDIYQADSGTVTILGGPMTNEKLNYIGYIPEERGLYQDVPLDRCLTYLATLKGMTEDQIKDRLPKYLAKFDLTEHAKKKAKELSKGMQQKGQLIAALLHDPEIIIIDEPFSALDPVNTQLVKDLLIEQRNAGKTIVMCTHQMNQVEQLCDRLVLIDHGQVLLQGELSEIRDRFRTNEVIIEALNPLPEHINGVSKIERLNDAHRLTPQAGISAHDLLNELVAQGIELNSFEVAVPTLDEIFIRVVKEGNGHNE